MSIAKREVIVARKAKESLEKIYGDDNYRKETDKGEKTNYLKDDFIHYLNGLPVFISQNGLLQAITFIKDKDKNKNTKLYKEINSYSNKNNLINYLIGLKNINHYVTLQQEIIEYTVWLKRIANALYKDPKSKEV